jgi:Prp8 binding protein
MSKRGASPPPNGGAIIKRARSNEPQANQIAISSSNDERQKGLIRTVKRTSNLDAPIVSLTGAHSVRVATCTFMRLILNEYAVRLKF